MDLKSYIRAIPDFPKPGILFRDISPLLANAEAMRRVIRGWEDRYADRAIDKVCGIESRGFLFGLPLALHLDCGFVPLRKAGKLPGATHRLDYSLEYGTASLEVQTDALTAGDKVVIVDDLLATGGTAAAAARLVEQAGATVEEIAFVIELEGIGGAEAMADWNYHSLIAYGPEES